eukprot:3978210-Pyramimonas_sp.AAC.1
MILGVEIGPSGKGDESERDARAKRSICVKLGVLCPHAIEDRRLQSKLIVSMRIEDARALSAHVEAVKAWLDIVRG